MAVFRKSPTCMWCGEIIAKAVYKNMGNNFIGDSFSHWDYKKHNCKSEKLKKVQKKIAPLWRSLILKGMKQMEYPKYKGYY